MNKEKVEKIIQKCILNKCTTLDLSHCNLTSVPAKIAELKHIKELNLSHNYINDLPHFIDKLKNLEILDVSFNCLNYVNGLPFTIGSSFIKKLDISNNNFNRPPVEIYNLSFLNEIKYNGNPFLEDNQIVQILQRYEYEFEKNDIEILNYISGYFDQLEFDKFSTKLFDAKIILIGRGGVGKTTLRKKLIDTYFHFKEGQEPQTHGVVVKNWEFNHNAKVDNEEDFDSFCEDEYGQFLNEEEDTSSNAINVKVWDFGGQEINNSTHQFFFTDDSIYIYLWESRKDGSHIDEFKYWLNLIKYISPESPLFVIQNKIEKNKIEIDQHLLNKIHNVNKFLNISCAKSLGLDELKESLMSEILKLKHIGTTIPISWNKLKNKINNSQKNYIMRHELSTIAKSCKIPEVNRESVFKYLVIAGHIIYYENIHELQDFVILNPNWLTNSFYKLLDSKLISDNNGEFQLATLSKVWDSNLIPTATHYNIIRIISKFDLCFKIPGLDHYILPERLGYKPINNSLKDENGNSVILYIRKYQFLPPGIFLRLMTRMFFMIRKKVIFKNYFELFKDKTLSKVQLDILNNEIVISVKGINSSESLALIKVELDKLHKFYNLETNQYDEIVLCKCNECLESEKPSQFRIETLNKYIERGKIHIECQKSVELVEINYLLKGVELKYPSFNLLEYIVIACGNLQGNHKATMPDEDSRNKYIETELSNRNIISKGQNTWGKSKTGKKQGELDIKIETRKGVLRGIFEGLNLKYLNRSKLKSHFDKVFNYNPSGTKETFIVSYCQVSNFEDLCAKYVKHVNIFEFKIKRVDKFAEIPNMFSNDTEIFIGKTKHTKNSKNRLIYHVLLNLN